MKDREYYLACVNPVWELTHDCAIAAFDFDWFWLDEIKAACKHYTVHSLKKKDTYRTILSIAQALQEEARKRKALTK